MYVVLPIHLRDLCAATRNTFDNLRSLFWPQAASECGFGMLVAAPLCKFWLLVSLLAWAVIPAKADSGQKQGGTMCLYMLTMCLATRVTKS